jgi:predicted metal-dependent HD superfamily phosphohydrolase
MLTTKSPGWAIYHSYEHTVETVEAAREIAEGSKLDKAETEIVLLAAWLHDVGYTECCDGHEERSADIARGFLSSAGYPPERIEQVARCILATKVPQNPSGILEQVVCDADMAHLGKKRFFRKNDLIRMETEQRTGAPMTDAEWLTIAVNFVASHRYHTKYALEEFQGRRTRNLLALQGMLREARAAEEKTAGRKAGKDEILKQKLDKAARPERGIETMFRVVPKNHLDLTAMADSKAHMMISTNSIIVSLVVGLLFSKIDANPHLLVPVVILFAVSLTAIIFAVLATRPKVTEGKFTKEDIYEKRANLLFFGNFHRMSLEDFEWGMNEMMKDREYLYGSMIRDLHSLGQVLATKYRYLRISFNVFMYGFILAVIAFIVAVLIAPTDLS